MRPRPARFLHLFSSHAAERTSPESVRHTPLPVNQCLENPPVDEVSSNPDALPPDAEVEARVPATGGEDESAPVL